MSSFKIDKRKKNSSTVFFSLTLARFETYFRGVLGILKACEFNVSPLSLRLSVDLLNSKETSEISKVCKVFEIKLNKKKLRFETKFFPFGAVQRGILRKFEEKH